jgi:hypothetical protein
MQFYRDMSCCNPHRERIGLACDLNQQITCAVSRLLWTSEHAPDGVLRILVSLIRTFPQNLALVRDACVRARLLPEFIERAAMECAALGTKTERHEYRAQFSAGLGAADLQRFDDLMTAEWKRLRGKQ